MDPGKPFNGKIEKYSGLILATLFVLCFTECHYRISDFYESQKISQKYDNFDKQLSRFLFNSEK